jgi:hypothetical protein
MIMNASPITTWEGAEAYFTFADNPTAMVIILGLSVVATIGAVIATIIHENETYIDYR